MAALPSTPRTWTDGETVTEAMMDTELRGSLRYLKGLDGTVTYDNPLTVPAIGVGLGVSSPLVTAPQARFDVRENGSNYAAIIENAKSSGSPNGLQVVSRLSASHVAMGVYSGGVGVGLTERWAVLGDGTMRADGRNIWERPLMAIASNDWPLSTGYTSIPNVSLVIPRAGHWEFRFQFRWTAVGSTANFFSWRYTESTGFSDFRDIFVRLSPANVRGGTGRQYTRYIAAPCTVTMSSKKDGGSGVVTLLADGTALTARWMGD